MLFTDKIIENFKTPEMEQHIQFEMDGDRIHYARTANLKIGAMFACVALCGESTPVGVDLWQERLEQIYKNSPADVPATVYLGSRSANIPLLLLRTNQKTLG